MARKQFERMVEILEQQEYLQYGGVIPTSVLEEIIGIRYDPLSWEWRGPLLELKMAIEEKGFFCTQRNESCADLRIIPLEKMPDKVKSVIQCVLNRQKRVIKTMKNAKFELLEEQKRAEHLNAINRMLMVVNSDKSPLANIDY